MVDYNIYDTRREDLNKLDFNGCNLNSVEIINPWSDSNNDEIRFFSVREFTVSNEVAKFALSLAYWKLPHVGSRVGMPERTEEEKLYHIFLGCIAECLTYLYLKSLGIDDISYYDVERKSPVYNANEEFDLKINDKSMSLKVIPALYQSLNNEKYFNPMDLVIKRTAGSFDRYYTQFIIPTESKLNYYDTMLKFINNINKGEPLFLKFWMLGGLVDKGQAGVFWTSRDGRTSKNEYLKFEKKYDANNYIQGVLVDNKKKDIYE